VWGEHPAPEGAAPPGHLAARGWQAGAGPGSSTPAGDGWPGDGAGWPGGGVRFGFPRSGPATSESGLRQYLITRALGRAVLTTVLWSGVAILALAAVCWLAHLTVLAVLVGLVGVAVLLLARLLSGFGRRLSGAEQLGPAEPQVRRLVARTGRGLRRELRRVGLPGSPLAPLLIALRLFRPYRRAATAQQLARVDLTRVVPASQLDELHLLLQSAGRLPER